MMNDADQHPDPEDMPYTVTTFWAMRMGEVLGASVFLPVLPWWKPLTWLLLVSSFDVWRYSQRLQVRKLPIAQRRWHYRWTIWVRMFFVGTGVYFLYVPNNNYIWVGLLGQYLVAAAALAALRTAGDMLRASVAVLLILFPYSLRLIFDGIQYGTHFGLMGLCGLVMIVILTQIARLQGALLTQQFELRRRAELAADAVAEVGLAKARFFAAVSHDLRQPVHAIGLFLDPVHKTCAASKDLPALKAIEGIQQSWSALDGLLSQVLDLTRSDSGVLVAEMAPVALSPLLRGLVMQHSGAAERMGVRMIALVKTDAYAYADELMLKRIVSNLIDNAIKFSPPGSVVLLTVRRAGPKWRLQVRDAGIGIAQHEQAMVFEEFVQLANSGRDRDRGLGLGLAIARRFAHLMESDLHLRSALGQGTCMTLILPRLAQAEVNDKRQDALKLLHPAVLQQTVHSPKNQSFDRDLAYLGMILLVEDDALVAVAMQTLLQTWGANVLVANNVEAARDMANTVQVAICDVRLPGAVSGLTLALELRERGLKAFLLTGEINPALRDTAREKDLQLLVKPVSPHTLYATLINL
jgi:two-component system, sensor histidine kinase